jgi:hypothetical protein
VQSGAALAGSSIRSQQQQQEKDDLTGCCNNKEVVPEQDSATAGLHSLTHSLPKAAADAAAHACMK